jgi:hypothetical protein
MLPIDAAKTSFKTMIDKNSKRIFFTSALLASICIAVAPKAIHAGRGLGASGEGATVFAVKSSSPKGLKLADAQLIYNDGDVLTGVFRVYCPTRMIRPTGYTLWSKYGKIKKQGAWWDPAFPPKWRPEYELVQTVCSSGDYGNL